MTNFGSRLMKENNLSIHVDTGDLYYNGVNTGEYIYDFVLSQKDFSKKIVKEKLYYSGTFEQYLSEFLEGFDAEGDVKLDTLTLFAGIEPVFVVHTNMSADEVVLENLRSRDWQYLVSFIIEKAETGKDYY